MICAVELRVVYIARLVLRSACAHARLAHDTQLPAQSASTLGTHHVLVGEVASSYEVGASGETGRGDELKECTPR